MIPSPVPRFVSKKSTS
uniref:Uncharacterized protein n=1 Tax=Arundo donax TaxID=35708 RepID=A0A0A9C1Z4_ARUDO